MPYGKFPEAGKIAVYKVGADKKKVGKRLGLHPDDKAANAQLAALHANEKKPKEVTNLVQVDGVVLPESVTTTGTSNTTTIMSDETENKDYYGSPVEVVLVESSYGPLTFADLLAEEEAREAAYEMQELNYKLQRLINNIMNSDTEDKAAALVALTTEYASLVSQEVTDDSDDKEKADIAQIVGDNQPKPKEKEEATPESKSNLFIWKEADVYHWLVAYSNNRRDDDNPPEIITTESHKEFDATLTKGEWPMPELWLWHIPYPVGITQYHAFDESTGFPVAAGVFNKGMEWAAEGVLKEGWDGASHGMPTEWLQRQPDNQSIIIRHRTKEITLLPTWAAANKLAFNIISKETQMADEKGLPSHKRPEFVKAFGEERVKAIEEALASKAKEADEAGIEQKEAGALDPMAEILKALTFFADELKGVKVELATLKEDAGKVKEETPFDLVTFLKEKSAIGKEETKVDRRSALAKDKPVEEKVPLPVGESFATHLQAANAAYYESRGLR